uniref:NADH-ubiquinone oxidoreductase chain 6 n=1 Tax=Brachymyrmex patagonicus TaxID=604570 RepID=A0A2U8XDQ0_9HYME|nr:NADH dehydrogenase subunit 6 [Brachymyrmex patagonicus]
MFLILFSLLSSLSILFNNNLLHPINVMLILILFSSLICLNLSIWQSNYIYSIILFLIMISGLLIIFLYFTSLISNEQTNFKFKNFLVISSILNVSLIMNFMLMNMNSSNMFNYNYNENQLIMLINKMNFQNILNLYEYPYNNFTILSMFYLLISLFTIIKICIYILFINFFIYYY